MRARENRDRLYTAGEAAPPAQPFGRTVAHVRATAVAFGVRGPPASLAQSLIDHRLRGWPGFLLSNSYLAPTALA